MSRLNLRKRTSAWFVTGCALALAAALLPEVPRMGFAQDAKRLPRPRPRRQARRPAVTPRGASTSSRT